MCIFSIRGINNLVNGDVHKEHYHNLSSSSRNRVVGGVDPFPDDNVDVYVTRYGDCYHVIRNCYEIKKSKLISKVSKKKAIRRGYVPCRLAIELTKATSFSHFRACTKIFRTFAADLKTRNFIL